MVKIPDSLRSVFSASVHERDGSYVLEIPPSEIEHEIITVNDTYRIAIFDFPASPASSERANSGFDGSQSSGRRGSPEPPVDEGEIREVTIETVGDQGDGIAKVERGYVVIVPGAQPGQQPTVEIGQVQENVAFASVIDDDPRAL
jgi:predicted RNA-binding protein with TRAM domain